MNNQNAYEPHIPDRTNCPSSRKLASFLCGDIISKQLIAHLKECPYCQQEAFEFYLLMNKVPTQDSGKDETSGWQPMCQVDHSIKQIGLW